MKKLFIIMILTFVSIFNIKAQTDNCGCTPVSTVHEIKYIICSSITFQDISGFQWTVPDPEWIQIRYTEVVCGGNSSIRVDEITTSTFEYQADLNGWTVVSGCIDPATGLPLGWVTRPMLSNFSEYDALDKKYIALLVPMPNGNGMPNSIYFSAGCATYARVEWPADSRMWISGGDLGGGHYVDLTTSLVRIPCGPGCCQVQLITYPNGNYTYSYIDGHCDNSQPDPSFIPTFKTTDEYGNPVTYSGTITQILGSCHPICNDGPPPPHMSTGLKGLNKQVEIDFSATPTLVSDLIKFTSSKPIANVEIYSMEGKKVIDKLPDNNELNLSSLPNGIYLMRVYFGSNALRTMKIEKQ